MISQLHPIGLDDYMLDDLDDDGRASPMPDRTVTIPLSDYKRLIEAATDDDMIVICETCGASLDRDEKSTASTEDYTGCWKVISGLDDDAMCRSYRAHVMGGE